MPAPVFISHSSRDKTVAETLCAALEQRGLACWISSRDITPGQNFQEAIVRALTQARVMVLVFSSHANGSDEIKKELALASQNRLAVVPVRVEDVLPTDAFKYELATRQWIDVFKDWEDAVGRLAAHVGEAIDQVPLAAPARSSRVGLYAALGLGLLAVAGAGIWILAPRPVPVATEVAPNPVGTWVTGPTPYSWDAKLTFTLRLDLDQTGPTIDGTLVETQTDRGSMKSGIQGGRLDGRVLTFYTQGREELGDTVQFYKVLYRGTIQGDEIAFVRHRDTPGEDIPEKFTAKRQ
jgi:hypothetical protein